VGWETSGDYPATTMAPAPRLDARTPDGHQDDSSATRAADDVTVKRISGEFTRITAPKKQSWFDLVIDSRFAHF